MLSQVKSLTFSGVNIVDVTVQAHISSGQATFQVVGLPDKIIAESRERVRAALSSIALELPQKRIVVNLSPADLMKEGSHFDLPIACCLLMALKILPIEELQNYLILGELGLDSNILPVSGVLPAAIGANARNLGLICPEKNGHEAAWSGNELVLAPKNLLALINHFKGTQMLGRPAVKAAVQSFEHPDFKDVIGQETAKRAMEVAASGNHNLLMIGTPGSGKSMLASRIPSILPTMEPAEILETSMIYSIAGEISDGELKQHRPFRAPHQTSSMIAMIGGGHSKRIMPGEISLANNGVLFLDEFPEFPRGILESLRQPMETKKVLIARANSHVHYPAKFQLIAAMNHCKCGYMKDASKACSKVPKCGVEYQQRISGPIMDRIDIFIEVNELSKYDTSSIASNETSKDIAKRVLQARDIQRKRYDGYGIITNSDLEGEMLYEFASPDKDGQELLTLFADKNKISMRSYSRILKVARTIADLDASSKIAKPHVAEALSYKSY